MEERAAHLRLRIPSDDGESLIMSKSHSAVDAAAGYYYQGLYALTLLLREADDAATVAVESVDDVVLEGATKTLLQLKHSLGASPPSLTVKSRALWKTLKVWIDVGDDQAKLVLVCCGAIGSKSALDVLTNPPGSRDTNRLLKELVAEAKRVRSERKAAKSKKKSLPHPERVGGTEAFLGLSPAKRKELISRVSVAPRTDNVTKLRSSVEDFFRLLVPGEVLGDFVDEIIKWWDYRVCRALIREMPESISRRELFVEQMSILKKLQGPALSETYSRIQPPDAGAGLSSIMERQIDLVEGGKSRKERAAIARWKARNQRNEWLDRDLSLQAAFVEFDEKLEQRWRERFDPLRDDLAGDDSAICITEGRKLLDWSHLNARHEVDAPGGKLTADYLVSGTYQQLSEELRVGWHRDWKEMMEGEDE